MASLLLKVRELFNLAQDGDIVLSKLCERLAGLQVQAEEDEFWDAFVHHIQKSIIYYKVEPAVERVIDFIANFATYSTRLKNKQMEDEKAKMTGQRDDDKLLTTLCESSDEEDEFIEPFLMQCLTFFVKHHNARERGARLRCCQLVNKVLNLLGDTATIDEDLSDAIYECMMIRIKDLYPPIRIQAVLALFRLQDPSDEECPVIDAYLTSLERDINFLVRKTILTNIAISRKTLPFLIDRVRDVNDINRKTAYIVLSEKVSIRALSIAQRIDLITNGLKNDISEAVKKSCGQMLKGWFRACDHNYVKLLEALDTESDPECSQLVLEYLLKDQSYEKLVDAAKQIIDLNNNKFIDYNLLTAEKVFFWHSLCKHAKEHINENSLLQDILLELTNFCEYIRSYAEKNFIDSAILSAFDGVAQSEFILEYLIHVIDFFDMSDEVGKKNLRLLIHDLLTLEVIPNSLIDVLVKQYKRVECNEDSFIQSIVEIIADIKEPLVKVVSTAMKEKSRMYQLQLARVSVNIHECNDDLECAIKQQDYQQAALLKDHIAELEKQKSDIVAMIDECQEITTKRVQREDDPETTLKCLTIGTAMLTEITKRGLNSTLITLKDDVFFEGVKNEDPYIRNEAVKGLGLLSLLKKEFAAQHLVFFLQVVQVDQEFVKITAIKVIFDLFLMYGLTTFDQNPEGVEAICQSKDTEAEETLKQNENNDTITTEKDDYDGNEETEEKGDTSAAEGVLGVLLMFLHDESSDLRSVVAEGMARVMITGRVVSANVLTRLILLWYNPISEDDAQLRHCLGTFLPAFAFTSRKNQEVVEQAFLPTIQALMNAPSTSPLSHIIVSNVVDLFIQLCDVKNMCAYSAQTDSIPNLTAVIEKYDDYVHDSFAMKISNEILSNADDIPYTKLLCKTLNQLTICPRNTTVINDLIDLSTQMIEALQENRAAKKLIEKFCLKLQGQSFIESTACESQESETNVNATEGSCNQGELSEDVNRNSTVEDKDANNVDDDNGQVFAKDKNMTSEFVPNSVLKNSTNFSIRSTRSTRSNRSNRNVSFRSPPPKMQRLSTSSVDFHINN